MTVRYEENDKGMYWVADDGTQGEPQKDLRHAMDDYELTQAGLKEARADEGGSDEGSGDGEGVRVHTGDDGGPAGQLIADNNGSAGESQGEEGDAGGDEG